MSSLDRLISLGFPGSYYRSSSEWLVEEIAKSASLWNSADIHTAIVSKPTFSNVRVILAAILMCRGYVKPGDAVVESAVRTVEDLRLLVRIIKSGVLQRKGFGTRYKRMLGQRLAVFLHDCKVDCVNAKIGPFPTIRDLIYILHPKMGDDKDVKWLLSGNAGPSSSVMRSVHRGELLYDMVDPRLCSSAERGMLPRGPGALEYLCYRPKAYGADQIAAVVASLPNGYFRLREALYSLQASDTLSTQNVAYCIRGLMDKRLREVRVLGSNLFIVVDGSVTARSLIKLGNGYTSAYIDSIRFAQLVSGGFRNIFLGISPSNAVYTGLVADQQIMLRNGATGARFRWSECLRALDSNVSLSLPNTCMLVLSGRDAFPTGNDQEFSRKLIAPSTNRVAYVNTISGTPFTVPYHDRVLYVDGISDDAVLALARFFGKKQ